MLNSQQFKLLSFCVCFLSSSPINSPHTANYLSQRPLFDKPTVRTPKKVQVKQIFIHANPLQSASNMKIAYQDRLVGGSVFGSLFREDRCNVVPCTSLRRALTGSWISESSRERWVWIASVLFCDLDVQLPRPTQKFCDRITNTNSSKSFGLSPLFMPTSAR